MNLDLNAKEKQPDDQLICTVLENCNFSHTSYVSVSIAYLTNILFPVTIITSGQNFVVGVQIILGISKETNAHIFYGSLPL